MEFVPPADYEATRNRLITDSSNRSGQKSVYLLGRTDPEADDLAGEIYRSQRIEELHRSDPDQEVKDYCAEQLRHAERLAGRLRDTICRALGHGSFVFRGQVTAVSALNDDLQEACKKLLATVASQVFDRYAEAPVRVETAHAEKFLHVTPAAITSALDPLGLVQVAGGRPAIKPDAKAIISVRDYISQNGTVDGKRLLDHFGDDPFGWSPDTVRYILATMLTVGGEIKLKISGREVTANNTQAQEALKTNRSFGSIGVSLRNERPDNDTLARAAERLTDLIGDTVIPLEQEISQAAARNFSGFQRDYAPLAEKLTNLQLAGADRARTLTQKLADVLLTDASDAPQLLGSRDSALYADLKWAAEVTRQLENGLEQTLRALQRHRRDIAALPDTGIPGTLRADVADDLDRLTQRLQKDDFYRHAADFNSLLTEIQARVQAAVCSLQTEQKQRLQGNTEDLQRLPEWGELNQQEQSNILADLDALERTAPTDLNGLQQLLARDYDINVRVTAIKDSVQRDGRARIARRIEEQRSSYSSQGITRLSRKITAPKVIRAAADLDDLIRQLHEIKTEQALYADFEISITLTE